MFKRLFLFFATNLLIIVTISIVLNILGVQPYLTRSGIDYYSLMVLCLVWGSGGALISLALSRVTAKWALGVQVIDPNNPGSYYELVSTVNRISKIAQLSVTPEVGVYESPEINAFATGPTKNRSLVAVSTGLLSRMNKDELEGVLGHEISHIANGDMVTMTLLQGIVNAFVMFFARIIAFAVSQNSKEENRAMINFFVTIALEIVLSLLGMLVVMKFSRYREFKADAGSAKLVGANKMIVGLQSLQRFVDLSEVDSNDKSLATLKINGGTSWARIFASHPPLEERINALKKLSYA